LGMIAVNKVLAEQFPESCIVLQIHDELIISVHEHEAHAIEELVKQTLEGVVAWNVPLEVMTCSGADWKEVTK
jgi:DNA polymerase I